MRRALLVVRVARRDAAADVHCQWPRFAGAMARSFLSRSISQRLDPKFSDPSSAQGMSIRCLQKPWGSSKTLGSLRNLGVPPKPWGPSTWARGRRKPDGAGARVASPCGQGTPPARWGPLLRPAGAARALRAPPVAPKFTYINSLTSG